MTEAEPSRDVRLAYEIEPEELVERIQHIGLSDACSSGGELGIERIPGDRGALEDLPGAARQERELLPERSGHHGRHVHAVE